MLSPGLHAFSRDCPHSVRKVDFAPLRVKCFGRASDGKNQELQCARGNTRLLAKGYHERADLVVGERGMVFDFANLRALREQLI